MRGGSGRRVLLVGHGDRHCISGHHHCLPICIEDIVMGRVHTLDRDSGCDPTFAADAASDLARRLLPRNHYDSVVTMHVPYTAWLTRPAPGKRRRAEGTLLRQTFFRNLHGAMRAGAELLMELPATALSTLVPPGAPAGVLGRVSGRGSGRGSGRRCIEAARIIAECATAPGGARRLFGVSSVGDDHCVLRKL